MFSQIQRLFLCVVLLLALDGVFGAAAGLVRQAPTRRSRENTNAARMSAGLGPLPPDNMKRGLGTRVASAKRSSPSDTTTVQRGILATDTNGVPLGFLTLQSSDLGVRYAISAAGSIFTATVFAEGTTTDLTLRDTTSGLEGGYFAGLVYPGIEVDPDTYNSALVGYAPAASAPGASPQYSTDTSIPGWEYETAIWTFSQSDKSLTAKWINHNGVTVPVQIIAGTDDFGPVIYLNSNPNTVSDLGGLQEIKLSLLL